MFDLRITSDGYSSWNEAAKVRVGAGLAFLPADFDIVTVNLRSDSDDPGRVTQYRCMVRAKEVCGLVHRAKVQDTDAYQALEHAIHMVNKSVLDKHVAAVVRAQFRSISEVPGERRVN